MSEMSGFLLVLALSTFAIIATHLMFYEILRNTWKHISDLKVHPHFGIFFTLTAIFFGHTFAIWLYALLYTWLTKSAALGEIITSRVHSDETILHGFETMLYFSASTYSSLGFGDVLPTGHLRILCGVQALNGLMLIGWSVTFTYFMMQHFWKNYYGEKHEPR